MEPTTELQPTAEQQTALDAFDSGMSMAIDALAGTGKSSTLDMLARSAPSRRGQYVAFNTSIVREAGRKFPDNTACQPDGAMVRVPHLTRPGRGGNPTGWWEVPIESLSVGDKVVSWNGPENGGIIRKRGRTIEAISQRQYDGPLVVLSSDGYMSRYTPEHPCIVDIGAAFDRQTVLYVMRRGEYYRIGVAAWRLPVDVRRNGLNQRAHQEGADALWVLAAYDTKDEALLAEALAQYEWQMPGWRFRGVDGSDITRFWSKVEPNRARAAACLSHFGRDIERPLWSEQDGSRRFGQQVMVAAACNVMDGMRVLIADNAATKGEFTKGMTPRRVWTPVTVTSEWYSGRVTSLTVADDHTYFADGILTHNCQTAHSIAFRSVGVRYKKRLDSGRMRGDQIARALGIGPQVVSYGSQQKVLQPSQLAGHVMRAITNFCQSADPKPTRDHVPYIDGLDVPDSNGHRTWANNDRIRDYLDQFLAVAWADIQREDGALRFSHDNYLKLWQLSQPQLGVDFLLVDEAQDLSPVMLSVVTGQDDCQLVVVGDANQSVYQWRGSINAMAVADVAMRARLTQSFRFGDAVADVANWCLGQLPTELRVKGLPSIDSSVEHVANPRAVLCRTNAGAMDVLFSSQRAGRRPVLLGGGKQIAAFARGAQQLMETGSTGHPDLWCFDSWQQVVEYVELDPQGDELALSVKLVEEYGTTVILEALDRQPDERLADVVVATAHAAKGREWESVRLHSDFRQPEGGAEHDAEWRLLYVAATRARIVLDIEGCPAFKQYGADDHPPVPGLDRSLFEPVPAAGLTSRDERIRIAEALS